jgi:hypothetical protein
MLPLNKARRRNMLQKSVNTFVAQVLSGLLCGCDCTLRFTGH